MSARNDFAKKFVQKTPLNLAAKAIYKGTFVMNRFICNSPLQIYFVTARDAHGLGDKDVNLGAEENLRPKQKLERGLGAVNKAAGVIRIKYS